MKPTTLARNGVSAQTVELISRLVESIPWPDRRRAMGDVTASLLEGKPRVAESVFGWSRYAVEVGIHEARSGISCINDLSARVKPRTEDKHPDLLADIQAIMEPHSQSEAILSSAVRGKSLFWGSRVGMAVSCRVTGGEDEASSWNLQAIQERTHDYHV